jgi:acyl-CoA thioester hydrolase
VTRLTVPIHLRWGDLDAFGHVNNATMLRLLEEARVRTFWAPAPGDGTPLPTAVLPAGPEADTLSLIAHQEIEYLSPVPYSAEPIRVEMWFSRIGGASIEICYEVRSPESHAEATYARATAVLVLVDAETLAPRRLTSRERSAWEPYLGDRVEFRRH